LHQAVTVPLAALQHGPNGLYVFIVKPDNTVQEQPVQVAYQDDQTVVIAKGVTGGQSIVMTGQSRLANGARVTTTAGNAAS
jgi:membrane fusion protein, multidrug efflux system